MKIGELKEILDLYDDEVEIIIKIHDEEKICRLFNASKNGENLEILVYNCELTKLIQQLTPYL